VFLYLLIQGNESTTCGNNETDDDEEEDSAVEMRPASQLAANTDVDDAGPEAGTGRNGGSVDSIDTLSSSADHTTATANDATGGKDQRLNILSLTNFIFAGASVCI